MFDRKDLRPYQERAVEFVKKHSACALFIDLGLGKTVSTLTAFSDLLHNFYVRRMLVVGPLRVARKVWPDELKNWSHVSHLKTSRIIGDLKSRWTGLITPADIHLINREQLPWLESQFIQNKKQVRRFPWDMVVIDESTSFKHQSSNRWKSMNRLRRLTERTVLLTAKPIPKGYGDLWGQFKLLDNGQRLGATETAFRDRWFDADKTEEHYTNWVLKPGADLHIQRAIADITLTLRAEDYLDLPPVMTNLIKVDMPEPALRQYRKFERECLVELHGKTITAVSAGACAGKLLQFANGALYHDDKGNYVEIHDAKLDALVEIVGDSTTPIMIPYGFKHDLARLQRALKATGKKVDVLKTVESENRWNAGDTDALLIHPASGGHGLNLQFSGCENIVWFGLTPDLDLYDQLNGRLTGGLRRVGRNVVVHHVVAEGTRDYDILAMLQRKDGTQKGLLEALASR